MIKYRILEERIDRVEFEYLYVWENGYECVDARYVNITSSREVALYNFRIYIYKLMYLNSSLTEDDFIFCGLNTVHETMKTYGVYILDSDVYKICGELFNDGFDNSLYDKIKTKKRVEWKPNIGGLLEGVDVEGKDVRKVIKNIKIKESLRCLNSLKMDKTKKIILNSILIIKEERDTCSVSDVSRATGISYNTVKRHYEDYMREFTLDEYYFMENKNSSLKDEKISAMKEAIIKLNNLGFKITKMSVSQYSGVSRNTVNKRWEELNKIK
jgi:DNA-binding transcriptional regulator YhcF (GntR family)